MARSSVARFKSRLDSTESFDRRWEAPYITPPFRAAPRITLVLRKRERSLNVPKMKTNSAAAKRFKVTGTGKVRRGKAGLSHFMRGKSASRRRKLRKNGIVSASHQHHIERLMPYAF